VSARNLGHVSVQAHYIDVEVARAIGERAADGHHTGTASRASMAQRA
jgi:hypothetical protein